MHGSPLGQGDRNPAGAAGADGGNDTPPAPEPGTPQPGPAGPRTPYPVNDPGIADPGGPGSAPDVSPGRPLDPGTQM